VIVLVHDDEVGVLAGVANALEDTQLVLRMRRVFRRSRQILGSFVLFVASIDAKLVDARPVGGRASARRNQSRRARDQSNRAFRRAQVRRR
jgi:hypothetical protein